MSCSKWRSAAGQPGLLPRLLDGPGARWRGNSARQKATAVPSVSLGSPLRTPRRRLCHFDPALRSMAGSSSGRSSPDGGAAGPG
eukprot:11083070-Lingulodinium_polyedra.AAC.1